MNRKLISAILNREHESAKHPVFGKLLWRAAYDVITTEDKLRIKANSIANDMARLIHDLTNAEEHPYFNSLGELQSRGPDLDRLCGVLNLAYENFDRLYRAWIYVKENKCSN